MHKKTLNAGERKILTSELAFTEAEVADLMSKLERGEELVCPRCGHLLKTMSFPLEGTGEEVRWFGCPGCARHGAAPPSSSTSPSPAGTSS